MGDLVIFDTVGTIHRRDTFVRGERRAMRQLSTLQEGMVATTLAKRGPQRT